MWNLHRIPWLDDVPLYDKGVDVYILNIFAKSQFENKNNKDIATSEIVSHNIALNYITDSKVTEDLLRPIWGLQD